MNKNLEHISNQNKGKYNATSQIIPLDLAKLNFQKSAELFQNEDLPQHNEDDFGENVEKTDNLLLASQFIEHSRIHADENNQSDLFSKNSQKFDFESKNNSNLVVNSFSSKKKGKFILADDIIDES